MGVQVIQHHPDLLRFRVSPNPPMDGVRTAEGGWRELPLTGVCMG